MSEVMQFGQDVFGASDLDVLEYRVSEVRHTREGTFYVLVSKTPIGQHREIKVMIYENKEGSLCYFELVDTTNGDCEFGLAPFVDVPYFRTLAEAKKHFAKNQVLLIDNRIADLNRQIVDYQNRKRRWEVVLRGE